MVEIYKVICMSNLKNRNYMGLYVFTFVQPSWIRKVFLRL